MRSNYWLNFALVVIVASTGCAYNQGVAPDGAPSYSSAGVGRGDPEAVANAGFVTRSGKGSAEVMSAEAELIKRFGSQYGTSDVEKAIMEINNEPEPPQVTSLRTEKSKELAKDNPNPARLKVLDDQLQLEVERWNNAKSDRIRVLTTILSNKRLDDGGALGYAPGSQPYGSGADGAAALRAGIYNYGPAVPTRHRLVLINSFDVPLYFIVKYGDKGGSYYQDTRDITPGRLLQPGKGICLYVPIEGPYNFDAFDRSDKCLRGGIATVNGVNNDATANGVQCDAMADLNGARMP